MRFVEFYFIPEFCTQLALNGHLGQFYQNDEEIVIYPIA
jgi:hypothetical protein